MSVLEKLTFESLKQNKRRTFFTIVGVALASALMLAVAGMVTSVQQTMIDATIASSGNYHEIYENVPAEGQQYIENNANIANFYYAGKLEYTRDEAEDFYTRNQHSAYSKSYVNFVGEEDKTRIFVRYKNVRQADTTREQILSTIEQVTSTRIQYRTNRQLIQYEGGLSGDMMKELLTVAAIVITIIAITSIIAIRNSFSISATERMREFGMLSSVGATKQQIRTSVILEGLMIWIVAAPIGILLGLFATAILATIVTALIGDGLSVPMAFSVSWWIFLTTIIVSLITVLLSALFPAIRAAKIPPVEAIRGNREIKIKPRKVLTSPLTRKIFGVGGVIASKNLKRAKNKYRTTVISIVVSVATFIGLSTFIDQAFGSVGMFYQQVDYDLIVTSDNTKVFNDIAQKFELDQMAYYQDFGTAVVDGEAIGLVAAVNQQYFTKYTKSIGLDASASNAIIVYDCGFVSKGNKKVLERQTNLRNGDTINILAYHTDDPQPTMQVAGVAKTHPLGFELTNMPIFLVSNQNLDHFNLGNSEPQPLTMFAATDQVEQIIDFIDEQARTDEHYDHVYAQNVRASMKLMNNLYLLVAIFLYGFIAVISLIGITNVFNTVSANMILRASEFASLKSIGMTSKEFNRMIRLESLMYSIKALVIGIPLGLIISWGFYKAMSDSYDFGYNPPIIAILIAVLAVAFLIWIVMQYSVKLVSKQNIIETIRSDTV